jgi:hypothetical protein
LGLPDGVEFMGDWHSPNAKVLAARDGGRLVGSNIVTRWGSFGFFGPLTVLPERCSVRTLRGSVGQMLTCSTIGAEIDGD